MRSPGNHKDDLMGTALFPAGSLLKQFASRRRSSARNVCSV